MRVDDRIRHCTVFLGEPSQSGFTVNGSAFFAYLEIDGLVFNYLITAAHVVWPGRATYAAGTPPDGDMYIRLNVEVGTPRTIKTARKDWTFHDDKHVDICAICFDLRQHDPNNELETGRLCLSTMTPNENHIAKGLIGLGDEVFIVGAFVGRVGERRNIPIVRVGHVAAMPEEPVTYGSPRHPAYLIETKSLGGTSGAPVLINLHQIAKSGALPGFLIHLANRVAARPTEIPGVNTIASPLPYNLVGMVLGAHGGKYDTDFISESDTDLRLQDAEYNAGISVVMPTSVIRKFLDSDKLRIPRERTTEEAKKQSGFRPTVA